MRPNRLVVLVVLAICVIWAGLLFVLARHLGWSLGWIYVGVFVAHGVASTVCVSLWNPVLIGRRMQIGAETKAWDIVWILVFLSILGAVYVVATRDLGTREPGPPGAAWVIGAAIFVSGWVLVTWSMVANPFFEKTVRIQADHGHRVVDRGPYAYIRHPGYVGFSALLLSTPLLLASTWTFLPALAAVLALVIRTVLEDRTLQAELAGYAEYATRVRFRLIPGVW